MQIAVPAASPTSGHTLAHVGAYVCADEFADIRAGFCADELVGRVAGVYADVRTACGTDFNRDGDAVDGEDISSYRRAHGST